jgi:hypothetical protein
MPVGGLLSDVLSTFPPYFARFGFSFFIRSKFSTPTQPTDLQKDWFATAMRKRPRGVDCAAQTSSRELAVCLVGQLRGICKVGHLRCVSVWSCGSLHPFPFLYIIYTCILYVYIISDPSRFVFHFYLYQMHSFQSTM